MKKERCYLICTADEYETALYCADTMKEVAEMIGVSVNAIILAFYRTKGDIIKVGGLEVERVWMNKKDNTPIKLRNVRC